MPNSRSLFVDTAGWGCYLDRNDPLHRETVTVCQTAVARGRTLVTTNYVIGELVALLSSRLRIPRPQLVGAIDLLKAASHVEIVHVDAQTDNAAWVLLSTRLDKDWSLVDAASFVVMGGYRMAEALTTDQHFAQAGFVTLLRRA